MSKAGSGRGDPPPGRAQQSAIQCQMVNSENIYTSKYYMASTGYIYEYMYKQIKMYVHANI